MKFYLILFIFLLGQPFMANAKEQKIEITTFPNGLKWFHKKVTHNKIMTFQLFFPGGAVKESEEKSGITKLMTTLMFKGTFHRSSLQLAQEIELLGASIGADSEEDFWDISGQVIVDKFDRIFQIFHDVLLNPSFPVEEFQKEKEALLNSIHTSHEQIFTVAYEKMQKGLFGSHPYARPEEGTEKSVFSLTREDLIKWHKKMINPQSAVFVTVGNISTKKLKKTFEKAFKDWKGQNSTGVKKQKISYPHQIKKVEEVHPFEQSYLMMAYPAPAIGHKDYAVVKVLNALLGSGMSSPLFQVIREEGTLAYEVSSFFPSRKEGSAFVIYAGMDPKNLELAYQKVKKLLKDVLDGLFTEEALRDAKRYIRGHYMMRHQTNSRMAWYLGWWELLGKGYAYDKIYLSQIDKVQLIDVNRMAKKIFNQPSTIVKIKSNKKSF